MTGPSFLDQTQTANSSPAITFLRKSGSLVAFWITSLATVTWCSFCSGCGNHRTNFATTCFMQRSCIKIWDRGVVESPDQLLVVALSVADLCWLQPVHVHHSQVFCLLQAFQNMGHLHQILGHCWGTCATLSFVLHSLHHPWRPSESSECFHRGMFRLNAKFDADSLLYSDILNVTATQYTCSLNGIHCPLLTSTVKLLSARRHMPVHSPWLPGYIDVAQTVLVTLTMAGLCLDIPHMCDRIRVFGPVLQTHRRDGAEEVSWNHILRTS